jgi:hypothetical protein
MTLTSGKLTKDELARFLDVSLEVIDAWDRAGVSPEFVEEMTAEGAKRVYTPDAIRAFCLAHRTLRVKPADTLADGPILVGGAFPARV